MLYEEAWEIAFKDYDSKQEPRRVRKIFDLNSEYNKCLRKYSDLCEEYGIDLDKELTDLGFTIKVTYQHSSSNTPQFTDYYCNDKGDCIEINQAGSLVVTFNDLKKSFESNQIGEVEKQALIWIKSLLDKENEEDNIKV